MTEAILGDESSLQGGAPLNSPNLKTKTVALLDSKKMQNVLIVMGKLRMTASKIADCIIQVGHCNINEKVINLSIINFNFF